MTDDDDDDDIHIYMSSKHTINFHFYRCTVHFEICPVHSPTNALFINLVKSFKFTLKYTIISLLHVSVSMTIIRELYLYLTKVLFMLKHSVKLRRFIYIYIYISWCGSMS